MTSVSQILAVFGNEFGLMMEYESLSFVFTILLDDEKDMRCLHIFIMPMIYPVPLVPMGLSTARASAV
jgi:hypothetical protein